MNGKAKQRYRPCLDHDHSTGAVRAILCNNCNGIEGKVYNLLNRAKRKRTVIAFAADLVRYWHHHKENRTGMTHPEHKTDEEVRLARNKKARMSRAASKLQRK